jgi:hypothetical protein
MSHTLEVTANFVVMNTGGNTEKAFRPVDNDSLSTGGKLF